MVEYIILSKEVKAVRGQVVEWTIYIIVEVIKTMTEIVTERKLWAKY